MYGRVIRTFPNKGHGFILGEDRKSYFIYYTKLNGEYIDSGYYVFFKPFQNDRSDYNAKNIMVIEAPERRRKHGNAIDYTVQRIGCSHQAVFDMRHKVLMSLQQLPKISEVCLDDVSEFDETFVLDCYKGKELGRSIPRKPRKYGAKAEKRGISTMSMCVSAQASNVRGMQLLPLSTAQNPAQGNWLIYLKAILQMGLSRFATACAVTMYFQGLQTARLRTATTRTGKIPAFIT